MLSGDGSVTQRGSGALYLTGTNTYSGGTTIDAGTLLVGADGAAGKSVTLTAQLSAALAGQTVTFEDYTTTPATVIGAAVTDAEGVASINYVLSGDALSEARDVRAVCGSETQTATLNVASPVAGWLYRKAITIDHTDVGDQDLTDFPLYVKMDGDTDLAAALSDGCDVRFTAADGTTLLDYERESWSESTSGGVTSVTATFWVKVPTISHTDDTTIYCYYGNADAPDGQNAAAVWTNGYGGVWHLQESGTGTAGDYQDSTAYGDDSTDTADQPTRVAGLFGYAQEFDGDQHIAIARSSSLEPQSLTMSAWVSIADNGGMVFQKPYTSWANPYFSYAMAVASTYVLGRVVPGDIDDSNMAQSFVPVTPNTWYYVSATFDGTNLTTYLNGVNVGSNALPVTIVYWDTDLWFGHYANFTFGYAGMMEEARLSDVARSPDWIKFEYDNVAAAGNEVTWGNEESTHPLGVSALTTEFPGVVAGGPFALVAQLSDAVAGRTVTFVDETDSVLLGKAVTDANGAANLYGDFPGSATVGCNHTIEAIYGSFSQTLSLKVEPLGVAWAYRKQITVDHTDVGDADLTDFPLYVKIDADADMAAAMANGYDVRFTAADGHTLLDYERESWSGGGGSPVTAAFWVNVPTISHTADTTIYLYYGEAGAADGQNAAGVWDSNYAGVWHLDSPTNPLDSTSNANNGTDYDATATTGPLGGAVAFNGTSTYISVPHSNALDFTGSYTLSAWVDPASLDLARPLFVRGDATADDIEAYVQYSDSFVVAHNRNNGGTFSYAQGWTNPPVGQWTLVTIVFSQGSVELYHDGVLVDSATGLAAPLATDKGWLIGSSPMFSSFPYDFFYGSMEEARMSGSARSADWINFEYENIAVTGNELTWGNPEATSGLDFSHLLIDPPAAIPGQTVTLTAQFPLSAYGQTVTFTDESDSVTIGTAVADENGVAAVTSYWVPGGSSLGLHTLHASYDGGTPVTASLTVSALSVSLFSVSLTPASTAAEVLGAGEVTIAAGAALVFNRSNDLTVDNTITGNGSLAQVGDGTLALSRWNDYSGGTTVSRGTLSFAEGGLGSGEIVLDGGTLQWAADDQQDVSGQFAAVGSGETALLDTGGNDVALAGDITGLGGLEKLGDGTLMLTGTNTYSGGTTVSGGILEAASTGSLPGYGTSGKLNVASGATVATDAANWSSGNIDALLANPSFTTGNLGIDVPETDNFSYSSDIGGGIGLVKLGDGTLTLGGTNTYAGDTVITAGTLEVGSADAIPSGEGKGNVEVDGTLDLADVGATVNGLSGGGTVTSSVTGAVVLTVGGNDQTSTFSGVVEDGLGTLSVAKTGSGTLHLPGDLTYTGETVLENGTIALGALDSVFADYDEMEFNTKLSSAFRLAEPGSYSGTFALSDPEAGGTLAAGQDGVLTWTPGEDCAAGTYGVNATYIYSGGLQMKALSLTIDAVDLPPRFPNWWDTADDESTVDVDGGTFNFVSAATCAALDAEQTTLTYSFAAGRTAAPAGAALDSNGHVCCTFTTADAGTVYDFFIVATDSSGGYDKFRMVIPVIDSAGTVPYVMTRQTWYCSVNENPDGEDPGGYLAYPSESWYVVNAPPGEHPARELRIDTYPAHGTLTADSTGVYYTPDERFRGLDTYTCHWQVYDTVTLDDYPTECDVAPEYIQVGSCVDLAPAATYGETVATDLQEPSWQFSSCEPVVDKAVLGVGATSTVTLTLENPWGDSVPAAGDWTLTFDSSKVRVYDSDGKEIVSGQTDIGGNGGGTYLEQGITADRTVTLTVVGVGAGAAPIQADWEVWAGGVSYPWSSPPTFCFEWTTRVDYAVVKADIEITGLTHDDAHNDAIGGLVVEKFFDSTEKLGDNAGTFGSNNAARQEITLSCVTAGWTGNLLLSRTNNEISVFAAATGGSRISFDGSENVFSSASLPLHLYVEGISFSSKMCDTGLTLQPQGVSGGADSVKYTVLFVSQPSVNFSSIVSPYNDKRNQWKNDYTENGTYDLGLEGFKQCYGDDGSSLGLGYEEHAYVFPIDFNYPGVTFQFQRQIQSWYYVGPNGDGRDLQNQNPPAKDDPDPAGWQDDTPWDSCGVIYDLDPPRLYRYDLQVGNIQRVRDNFEAWVMVNLPGQFSVQCSFVRQFHVCLSTRQAGPGINWVWQTDVAGDNSGGYGLLLKTTDKPIGSGPHQYVTWNLQAP